MAFIEVLFKILSSVVDTNTVRKTFLTWTLVGMKTATHLANVTHAQKMG